MDLVVHAGSGGEAEAVEGAGADHRRRAALSFGCRLVSCA